MHHGLSSVVCHAMHPEAAPMRVLDRLRPLSALSGCIRQQAKHIQQYPSASGFNWGWEFQEGRSSSRCSTPRIEDDQVNSPANGSGARNTNPSVQAPAEAGPESVLLLGLGYDPYPAEHTATLQCRTFLRLRKRRVGLDGQDFLSPALGYPSPS